MRKLLLPFVMATALTGCATQTFNIQGDAMGTATQETTHHFFVSGLGQTKTVDAAGTCGGAANVAAVQTTVVPLNALFSWLTSGIYTPSTAKVFCAG